MTSLNCILHDCRVTCDLDFGNLDGTTRLDLFVSTVPLCHFVAINIFLRRAPYSICIFNTFSKVIFMVSSIIL